MYRIVGLLALYVSLIAGQPHAGQGLRSECLNLLKEAKKVGLPLNQADLDSPKATQESRKIEQILAKADKVMRRNQESISSMMEKDLKNLQRKKEGKPEIPYRQETPKEKADRERDVLKVLDELRSTHGPRVVPKMDPGALSFGERGSGRGFVKLAVGSAEALAQAGKFKESIARYRLARRLVDLSLIGDSMVSVISQNAAIQAYYASLGKTAGGLAGLRKLVTPDLVARFVQPSIARILQAEFLESYALMTKKDFALPKEEKALTPLIRSIRSWTVAYPVLKKARNGAELAKSYSSIASKMETYDLGDDDKITFGPSWADRADVLDKTEVWRADMLKKLGM
ncbi:MAG: hypothetical protein GC165_20680 [Armatimonadetes bacterium]|nr:hypothetical protein [Armatimonadota bacterium]